MPEADPHATFRLVLAEHQHLDPLKAPLLVFRQPKRSDTKKLTAALEALQELEKESTLPQAEAAMDQLEDAIRSLLVDWKNQTDAAGEPLAFDASRLDEVLDESQLGEVGARVRIEPGLSSVQKKTFALQSASSLASTAAAAHPGTDALAAASLDRSLDPTKFSAPAATETPPPETTPTTNEPSAPTAKAAGAST